jgi:hypothetical protein
LDRAGGFGRIISGTGARYRTSVSCKYLRVSVDLEVDDNFAVIIFRPVGVPSTWSQQSLGASAKAKFRGKSRRIGGGISLSPTCLPSRRQAGAIRSRPETAKRAREQREPGGDGAGLALWGQAGDTFGILIAPGYGDSPKPRFFPKLSIGSGSRRRSARQAIDPISGGGLTGGLTHSCQSHSEMRARSCLQSTLVCLISFPAQPCARSRPRARGR